MPIKKHYIKLVSDNYGVKASFLDSFLDPFSIHENNYNEAVIRIYNRTVKDAILSDVTSICKDGNRVLKAHKNLFSTKDEDDNTVELCL